MHHSLLHAYPQLLEAIAFAARAHKHQLRKDRETPYASHVFRVCMIVQHFFGVEDIQVAMAAVLHDTIEDTTTDFDDLAERFGTEVAEWVAALSKDMRLPEDERELAYLDALRSAPWQVKLCKLADILDNTLDSAHLSSTARARTLKRSRLYLDAVRTPGLPENVVQACRLVDETLRENETHSV